MAVAESAGAQAKPIALEAEETKVRTPLGDAWRQFRQNRLAVLSGLFVIALILVALGADILKGVPGKGLIDDPTFQHEGREGIRMAFAPPMTCSVDPRRQDPQWCFVLGSDYIRRDNLSRLVYGARVSLAVAFVGASVTFLLGIIYGVVSGYYGGRVDNLMMRFVDFLYGIPGLPIIILMQVFFKTLANYKSEVGPLGAALVDIDNSMGGLFFLFIAIGALGWIDIARLARGQVLSYKQKEFVEAARAVGARDRRIIFVHLLPNIIGPLVVVICLSIPGFIFTEAALSYLGLGVNPPTPSWGEMINTAQQGGFRSQPHLVLAPGVMLSLTTLAFNFLGDGLRDALDPKLRGG